MILVCLFFCFFYTLCKQRHLTSVLTFLCTKVYRGLWKEIPVVIKCSVKDPVRIDGAPDSVLRQEISLFDKPTRGTSMDEFKEMMHSYLKVVVVFFSTNYCLYIVRSVILDNLFLCQTHNQPLFILPPTDQPR